ncbi:flagellin C-terminal helical region [Devosia crocina]|uniref:Flagellin n=1 Tax=Devosia crocina TaxID=429728 RepID=A0A1I7N830_9HYPH|nr:flagellin [Devosia crocina]SFV30733.1 flagellin C-terminal helical region [Devosia crocina]
MSAVNLASSTRFGLTALRNVADQMEVSQKRLATGKAVNTALDNVSKFFTASKMDGRAAAIDTLSDGVNNAQTALKAASEGIKGIQGIVKQARALTGQALSTSDADARKALAAQFTTLTAEISKVVTDSKINGTNLLNEEDITVTLSEDGSSKTTIEGIAVGSVAAVAGDWATEDNIKASVTALNTFSDTLETAAASFGTSQALISVRKDFNNALSNILKTGASELTAADMDAEAANLMALQTRQQMASTALSIMQSNEATALRLLR